MRLWLIKYALILGFFSISNVLPAQTTGIRRFKISEGSDATKILTIYKSNQGFIYAGTVKGLYKFDGTKFILVPFQNPVDSPAITSIFQDNQNQLWVGLQTGDIAKLVNNHLKFFTPEEGTPKKPITAFLQDKKNNIWFATDGEGIFYIANNRMYNINSDDGLSENSVYSLTLSDDDEVLAG